MFLKLSCDFRLFFGLILTQNSHPFYKCSFVWLRRHAVEQSNLHFLPISALCMTFHFQQQENQL